DRTRPARRYPASAAPAPRGWARRAVAAHARAPSTRRPDTRATHASPRRYATAAGRAAWQRALSGLEAHVQVIGVIRPVPDEPHLRVLAARVLQEVREILVGRAAPVGPVVEP